jgi:hypothetical protein
MPSCGKIAKKLCLVRQQTCVDLSTAMKVSYVIAKNRVYNPQFSAVSSTNLPRLFAQQMYSLHPWKIPSFPRFPHTLLLLTPHKI